MAVLSSAAIPYQTKVEDGRTCIIVAADRRDDVLALLGEFEEESVDWPPQLVEEEGEGQLGMMLSILVCLALMIFFFVTGSYDASDPWFINGRADSDLISNGQYWRLVTALTLHADFGHMLGNVACSLFLGATICRYLGYGTGWLLILVTGIGGNLITALTADAGHRSIGVSTAVFGALGLLGTMRAMQFLLPRTFSVRFVLLPIIAVIALLGQIGAGPGSDWAAHLWGVVCGLALGVIAPLAIKVRENTFLQSVCLLVFIIAIVHAWRLAFGG
ncbi:MAG TPA: hypothetical protein DIT01_14925 [Lentisphaeria bacterium]|nr:hypothetical protein [Lentisphaeria bacterium]|tara:strand:- start:887 stop:1708 length:822 start_codon:yes stop_codon:yes gene_type:complete